MYQEVVPHPGLTSLTTYRIEYSSEQVRFYMAQGDTIGEEDQPVAEFSGSGVPRTEMYLMANVWWPVWLDRYDP